MLTLKDVQESLPAGQKSVISQEMVDQLNNLSKDPEEARYIRENFISFTQVLQEGRFKLGGVGLHRLFTWRHSRYGERITVSLLHYL